MISIFKMINIYLINKKTYILYFLANAKLMLID